MNHAMVVTRVQAEREKEEAELQRQQTERSGVRPREVEGLDGGDGRTKKEIRKFLGLTGYYRRRVYCYIFSKCTTITSSCEYCMYLHWLEYQKYTIKTWRNTMQTVHSSNNTDPLNIRREC